MNSDQLIGELNDPSRVLAEELFRRFSAWTEFAEVYRGPDLYDISQPGSHGQYLLQLTYQDCRWVIAPFSP